MIYEYEFLKALLLTIFLETLILFFVARSIFKINKKIPNILLIFSGVFCSFLTLPYVWFILPVLIKSRLIFIILGETFAVLVEAVIYWFILKISFKRSLILSFVCNMFSFLVGLLLRQLFS